ncbi:snoRNA-binding rRNA-processing protein utp10 [Myotisia sp. PD_48]|nr:snoRNA-binding rRNA-processing protein utp10 [Myotisia sp. PD_48]
MASSLAAQLSQIAAKSTHQFDLKAQRSAHAKSLIFEKKVAATQDFETVFQLCYEGFQELCALDPRFQSFRRNLFSDQSISEDRGQMTAAQNKDLDHIIEEFLSLVGSRLLINPALRAVEWLVRRFRIHEFNIDFLILTFLPYHTTPLFANLLSILPDDLGSTFKVLYPYKRSLTLPPRHPIVHSAATNRQFFSALNNYVLQTCKLQAHYQGLISFWAGITAEALASMFDSARSGRIEVERRNKEDVLLRIMPTLNTGFTLKKVPQAIIACYMICVVLANKGSLSDATVDSIMEAVVGSWSQDTIASGIICLSVLAQQKDNIDLPKKIVKAILGLENAVDIFAELNDSHSITKLMMGLVQVCSQKHGEHLALPCLTLVRQTLQQVELKDEDKGNVISALLRALDGVRQNGLLTAELQQEASDTLTYFTESESLQPILQEAIRESGVDVSSLEMALQLAIEAGDSGITPEDVDMEDATDEATQDDSFSKALETLSNENQKIDTFLLSTPNPVFFELARTFVQICSSRDKLARVLDLPILRKKEALQVPTYLSFLIRIFSGPYPAVARSWAIGIVGKCLSESKGKKLDVQALLPYTIAALSDSSSRVRVAAASLMLLLDGQLSESKEKEEYSPWGKSYLYGSKHQSNIIWCPTREVYKFVHEGILPSLEECSNDASQCGERMVQALRGDAKELESGLKKSTRRDFFSFFCSHIVNTPLFAVKLRLLRIVNRVGKIGSSSRVQFLSPLLDQWQSMGPDDIKQIESREHVSIPELEEQIVSILHPKDKESGQIVLSVITNDSKALRPSFIDAVFVRLQDMWPALADDNELLLAEKLLDICLGPGTRAGELANSSRDLLRAVDLSGPVISSFLATITSSTSFAEGHSPAPKRRRTSQNNFLHLNSDDPNHLLQRVSLILEIIDTSRPEEHPELLGGLFQTLSIVHRLKLRVQSEMSYLLSLNLSILLSIINKSKETRKKLDTSVIRADLIIDCVRTSESPQFQNTALLLVAALASLAPEIILHSVMPIFTFMGSNVLRKDDEYSALVIDQTIDQVIPPLVRSLRAQKRDVVTGTSELLLSFTTAYEHIPSYRRLRLFESLVNKLGQEDILFAVLAMLATKYGMDRDVLVTITALASNTEARLQLITYARYLGLIQDALQPKPTLSRTLLGIGNEDERDPHKVTVDLLHTLSHLLKFTSLRSKIAPYFESDTDEDAKEIHALFSNILERLLSLAETVQSIKPISDACGDALATLLGTLSLVDFIDTIEVLLQRKNDDLRRKVLRLLEHRLEHTNDQDKASQSRALEFLSVGIKIIETSSDTLLKHAAVASIEKISEKYGKKGPEKVVDAAMVVCGDHCMGQADGRIRVMGVLCLASMTEVIAEAIIPVLPVALPRALDLLEISIKDKDENPQLHDAVYSFISALLVHIPYMFSAGDLDRVLRLSSNSAAADLPQECDDTRQEMLQLSARKVEAKEVFNVVGRNWDYCIAKGPGATQEILSIVKTTIEKRPKSEIVKNISTLSNLLWKVFDFRHTQTLITQGHSYEPHEVDGIESDVNDVAIKMIYKLNDTLFRPIFLQLNEWATQELDETDKAWRLARLTTYYKFLNIFFSNLKVRMAYISPTPHAFDLDLNGLCLLQSIVTGYSSYFVENAVEVLKTASSTIKEIQPLWTAVMGTLRNSFEHDQDEFWQSPSNLAMIAGPLISQVSISTNQSTLKLVLAEAVPTIVALAGAADSPDNHKELNTHLMKYMRAGGGNTAGVNGFTRLAAVKCEQALTERLGEEWLVLLPEMLPYISELMEDDDENVEKEVRKWVLMIEEVLGEKLDDMLA